jgi:hypothetical protein
MLRAVVGMPPSPLRRPTIDKLSQVQTLHSSAPEVVPKYRFWRRCVQCWKSLSRMYLVRNAVRSS